MNEKIPTSVQLVAAALAIACLAFPAFADDDDSMRRRRDFRPVDNPVYAEQCGACHFAYLPELLPADSWRLILQDLPNHNGAEVPLEPAVKENIEQYLSANSAEKSPARRAGKIMKSLRGLMPRRVSETPYIRGKHHEIAPETIQKKAVGSLSNCPACHTTAKEGIFNDDFVKIPE